MSPTRDRLTALDAAFLHIERDGLPIHVASVATFEAAPLLDDDGNLRLEELRQQASARLRGLPRLRRRVVWPPLAMGRPCWVDDPDFDIADHIDAVELPSDAGPDALRHYAEALVAECLPADRPLWHLRLVTGLPDERIGVVERVHHALVDGVSGVDVATLFLDLSPDSAPAAPEPWSPAPAPTPFALAVEGLAERAAVPLRLAGVLVDAVHPVRLARRTVRAVQSVTALAGDGLLAPRSLLNGPVGRTRRLAWISTRLEDARQAGHERGGTTNDVVLAAVAHGLRALLLDRGVAIGVDEVVKVLVPVSLREAHQRGTLGNRVGALLLPLPIGLGDPDERLRAIVATSKRLKAHREADGVDLLLAAASLLPPALDGPVSRLTDHQPFVNIVVTNVPGPPVPLYCLGARMLEAFPVVPLGGNLPLGVAILSYDGMLNVSVTVDAEAFPDVEVLRDGIREGFAAVGAAWRPTTRQRSGRRRVATTPAWSEAHRPLDVRLEGEAPITSARTMSKAPA